MNNNMFTFVVIDIGQQFQEEVGFLCLKYLLFVGAFEYISICLFLFGLLVFIKFVF